MTLQIDNDKIGQLPSRRGDRGNVLKHPGLHNTVWAFGGGKGGVGKSFVTVNTAVLLTKMSKKVLIVDADLGAANLHTLVGAESTRYSLSAFMSGNVKDFASLVTKTPIPNLEIVSGDRDSLDSAIYSSKKIERLRDGLRHVDHDYILLDTGPGTAPLQLDILLSAEETILISTGEPTSIENTYRLMKCLFIRKMRKVMKNQKSGELENLLKKVFSTSSPTKIKKFGDIFFALHQLDPEQEEYLRAAMEHSGVSLLFNNCTHAEDARLGPLIKRGCQDYFDIETGYLGFIQNDEAVTESVRNRTPLVVHNGGAPAAHSLNTCLQRLLLNARRQAMAL
ncbi:MAG: P-loop NTPase [Proteobacteria bacterium]|nr:P-loop NTPase [Pseudomonadota bacterium]